LTFAIRKLFGDLGLMGQWTNEFGELESTIWQEATIIEIGMNGMSAGSV
jgi:hypothetical protein